MKHEVVKYRQKIGSENLFEFPILDVLSCINLSANLFEYKMALWSFLFFTPPIFFFRLSKSDSLVFRVRVGWNKNETFCRLLSKYFTRWWCKWESSTGDKMATKAQMVDKWPVTRMNSRIFTKTQSVNQKYSEIFLNVIFCDFQFKLSMKHQIHN